MYYVILYSIHEKNVVKIQRIFANLIWEVVYTFSPYLNFRKFWGCLT